MERIAALIPAAGFSSRMGLYKPLLPLSPSTLVIERAVNTFLEAGISDLKVIVGHKVELLSPVLERLGVEIVLNKDYEEGMYSSVRVGVQSLTEKTEAFFFLPADYPLVSNKTIEQIAREYNKGSCEIIYPVYQGQRGHPPLISKTVIPSILESDGQGGLRRVLQESVNAELEVPVDDKGILIDLDYETDYKKIIQGFGLPGYPTRPECEELWQKEGLADQIIAHSLEVARVAGIIGELLNSKGYYLHLGLIMAASLLHDIKKGEKNHAQKGKERLAELGFPEVASIIETHMDLPPEYQKRINEHSIVYLADKMVQGCHVVSLKDRLASQRNRFGNNTLALKEAKRRLDTAGEIQKRIESTLGFDLGEAL
jgi:molybdenum cofactor cytidylyltransferase